MIQVNIHRAKTNLSELVKKAEAGEEIRIARDGIPVVQLVALPVPGSKRILGQDRGLFEVPDDFDEENEEIHRIFFSE